MNQYCNKKSLNLILLALITIFANAQDYNKPDYNKLNTPYLGQKAPGMIPELFAPFITNGADHKHSAPVFTPDGKEMFFSFYPNRKHPQRIYCSSFKEGKWTEPFEMPYSGKYQIGGPVISPDGNRVYFYCKKPINGEEQRKNGIIWFSEKEKGKWSDLKLLQFDYIDSLFYLPSYITNLNEMYLTIGMNGISTEIYKGKIEGNKLIDIVKLNENINTKGLNNGLAVISPDNSSMIFWRFDRNDFSTMGLYMSILDKRGKWSEARPMGDMINTGSSRFPGFSPDGKYFFFTSSRTGKEEIYWVDAKIINYLKSNDLNLSTKVFETFKTKGKKEVLEYYDSLKHKYNNYYLFNGTILNTVAEKLLKEGERSKASELINHSIFLYPDNQPLTQNLLLAAIEADENKYKHEVTKISEKAKEPDNSIETQLNRLGYKLIEVSMKNEAIKIFTLNTSLFPNSSNAYDSLGEAYMHIENKDKAIENYKKSLELNPDNKNSKEMIEKLNNKP